jgi:WD40 repeat protein
MRLSSLPLIIWCVAQVAAQPAAIKVPGLGFAWDARAKDIRTVHGIPGAAVLGDVAGITGYDSAVISPRQDLALAVSADGKVQAIRLATGEVREIPGILATPSRLVFSPSGHTALAIGTGLQIITGLSNSPAVQDLSLPPASGTPSAIAISDDGQFVFFSAAADEASAAWLLTPGTAPLALNLPGPVSAASFQPGSRDAIAVGRDGAVYRILNSTFSGDVQQVFAADQRSAGAVAVRVSPDGTRVYTANRIGTITVLDLAASALQSVDCGCTPTSMEPLNASGLYRITEISDRPLMLFDVSQPTLRVWFVPSAPAADSQRSAQ